MSVEQAIGIQIGELANIFETALDFECTVGDLILSIIEKRNSLTLETTDLLSFADAVTILNILSSESEFRGKVDKAAVARTLVQLIKDRGWAYLVMADILVPLCQYLDIDADSE